MLEAGLLSLLQAVASVQAICEGRICPLILPDDATLPALSYQSISSNTTYALDGTSITVARVQFGAFAHTYLQAKELAAATISALDGFQGTLPDGSLVRSIVRASSHDVYEDDPHSWRVSFDFKIST